MSERAYFTATRTVKNISARSVGLYIGSVYGHPRIGDVLDIQVYNIDQPDRVFMATKTVQKKGSTVCISLDSTWEMFPGDMIVMKYCFINRDVTDNGEDA